MSSAAIISIIDIESEPRISIELNDNEKFNKRFNPNNRKQKNSSKTQEQSPSIYVYELRAEDIQEYRLHSLVSLILCFFIIAPIFSFYHSRRIREMKKNQELTRAQSLSYRVHNLLILSNIIGTVIWVAILFVISVLFIMGDFI
ncbi:unnamed protein product [Rotaria magnacalcarata]|uniref:Uncharacterized protein n=1 Tax=Rotaria magnacalcarata TaxID=392030 RepID=A0A817AR22_9BILA|nr:unnamed protein product [Rotaria magnacalcarata]CAF1348173.1 unnamed protein product [Rotaria magnacalcarata]CAF1929454.1 unnamed protein product [Rotaria magnacalcarata]CAF2104284.1 unnamed protein product [Rotaria magnacalcarata]CAF2261204.1 unnamed protein product [Rotaria magnacalcarata]